MNPVSRMLLVLVTLSTMMLISMSSQAKVTIEPNITVVGREVRLECVKLDDEAYVNWYHRTPHSTDFMEFLAANRLNEVRKHFTANITIVRSEPGHSILNITNVNKHHGGTFKCCDDEICKYFTGTTELSVIDIQPCFDSLFKHLKSNPGTSHVCHTAVFVSNKVDFSWKETLDISTFKRILQNVGSYVEHEEQLGSSNLKELEIHCRKHASDSASRCNFKFICNGEGLTCTAHNPSQSQHSADSVSSSSELSSNISGFLCLLIITFISASL